MPQPTLLLVTGLPRSGKTSIAEAVASDLNAAVVGYDWVMAALRSRPEVWNAMTTLEHVSFRTVGWSVMWNVATAQLREGRSVILDGVARTPEVLTTRNVADSADARSVVALCEVDDANLHRSRLEARVRGIPGWPELTWDDVERSRFGWQPPDDVDVFLDARESVESNLAAIRSLLAIDRR